MGLGLVSGLNLYATVLTLGLGIRLGLITLNPEMSSLDVLSSPYVLVAAAIIYLLEFFADKIPWVDSIWDAVHTVIRPLGAALIGAAAIGTVEPRTAVIAALCAGVSFSGHSVKAGTRLLVNHSPEPYSNIALSVVEDVLVVAGTWLAMAHPALMMSVVVVFLVAFVWFAPKAFRLMRVEYLATVALLKRIYLLFARQREESLETQSLIRCTAGKGIKKLRHSVGYLQITDDSITFVTKRFFRRREHRIDRKTIADVQFKKRLLLDRLIINAGGKQQHFYFFKDVENGGQRAYDLLNHHKRYDTIRTSNKASNPENLENPEILST